MLRNSMILGCSLVIACASEYNIDEYTSSAPISALKAVENPKYEDINLDPYCGVMIAPQDDLMSDPSNFIPTVYTRPVECRDGEEEQVSCLWGFTGRKIEYEDLVLSKDYKSDPIANFMVQNDSTIESSALLSLLFM